MKISIFGVKLDALTKVEAETRFLELINKKSTSIICTVNSEFIYRSLKDEEFKKILNQKSSLNLIDGAGLVLVYMLLRFWRPKTEYLRQIYIFIIWFFGLLFFPITLLFSKRYIPERIAGADFAINIAKTAAKNNYRIFLLGNKFGLDPNVTEKVSLNLQTEIYNLRISGCHTGTNDPSEDENVIKSINDSGADIVFVAFGSPDQENWLVRNLHKTEAKVGIGLGGTFDFIAGVQKRAPKWMQKLGFEWLFRLFQNPRRLKRQMVLPKLFFLTLKEMLKQ